MTVFDLKKGQMAQISEVRAEGSLKARLNSLGICAGARVELISFSLFKSSVLIACAAVRVGLRKNTARKIEVKVC